MSTRSAKAAKTPATKGASGKPVKSSKPASSSEKAQAKAPPKSAAPARPAPPRRDAVEADPVHLRREVKSLRDVTAGEMKNVEVAGPCRFLGGTVCMQGAAAGVSQVGLEIDGELVAFVRPDEAVRRGITSPNASGVYTVQNSYQGHWTLVFGWAYPVRAVSGVRLSVMVQEPITDLELSLVCGA